MTTHPLRRTRLVAPPWARSARSAGILWAGFLGAGFFGVLSGCGSTPVDRGEIGVAARRVGVIEPADFAGAINPEAAPSSPGPPPGPSAIAAAIPTGGAGVEDQAGAGPGFVVSAGRPEIVPDAAPVSAPRLVESKVGDINGLPIFASEFLEPLSGTFEVNARRLSRRDWINEASNDITRELNELVLDELLRAEAADRLTPEQQFGLAAFLEVVRRNLLSQSYGSRELAARRLAEQRGQTEEEFLDEQRQSALVQLTIEEQIQGRVSVSSRDVQQRYERDIDRYVRPPLASYRLISVRATDAEARRAVEQRLASGEPFESVAASDLNRFSQATAGAREVEVIGERSSAELFGPALNAAAQTVEVGGVAGPIEAGASVFWITLESIQTRSRSLYDAQLEIESEIRAERTQEELQRFLGRSIDRTNVGTLTDIHARLLRIAIERYAPGA